MKKGLLLLMAVFMAFFGVSAKVMADVRSEALNANPQMIDDMDLIFLYPNLANDFKNVFDIRTNSLSSANVWGGLLDGEHSDLGVIGAYVNRPVGYDGGRAWYFNGPGWNGVGSGWAGNSWDLFSANYTGTINAPGHFTAPTPENKVDVFWASNLDNKTNFGVQVNYADNQPNGGDVYNNQNTNSTDNSATAVNSSTSQADDARVLGINLGLGMQDFGPFNTANIHLGYYLGSLDMEDKNTPRAAGTGVYDSSLKDGGIYTATLGALLKHNLDENSDMRVFANAYLDQNNQKEVQTFDSTGDGLHNNAADWDERYNGNYNDILLDLGAGCHHKVLDGKAVISSGLEAVWANSDSKLSGTSQNGNTATVTYIPQNAGAAGWDEQTLDEWSVQWNANVEAKASDWLTIRAGINRPVVDRLTTVNTINTYNADGSVKSTVKNTSVADNYFGGNNFTYSTGFGINWENWELDGVVRTASLFNSINNVSPGNGIFFTNGNGIVTVYDADLRFRF